MRRKIGTRIVVMLMVMTAMFVASSVASGFAQEQALGGMNRLYKSWGMLERYETQLVKVTDKCNFYSNMIVHYDNPTAQENLANQIPGFIEQTKSLFAEMHAMVDNLEEADLAGVTYQEVKAALTAYEEATAVVQNQAGTVAALYLAGDIEASVNANNGAGKNLEALGAAETYSVTIRGITPSHKGLG